MEQTGIRPGYKMRFDPLLEKYSRESHGWEEITVCLCEACNRFYRPSLGHRCVNDSKGISESVKDS